MDKGQKVYLDCTFTYHSGLNTGIQRVVRNLVRRIPLFRNEFGIEAYPIISFLNRYYYIYPELVLNTKPVTASLGARIKLAFEAAKRACLKLTSFNHPLNKCANIILSALEYLLKKCFSLIKFVRTLKTVIHSGMNQVNFESDDIFIQLDAFWTYNLKASIESQKKPKKTIAVVYDLIPIHFPGFVEDIDKTHFNNAMPVLVDKVDLFLCISKSVKEEMKEYIKKFFPEKLDHKDVCHFTLGSDFKPLQKKTNDSPHPDQQNIVRADIKNIFRKSQVWIVVGTIEPRKNHHFIIDSFEKNWAKGSHEKLFIIGRIGWKCDDVIKRLENHPELNNKLFFLNDVSDLELHYSYKHANGLIFASYTEGFGLPIVEAMQNNLRILCSDIPIFREVGGSYPLYFDLKDPNSLTALLEKSKYIKHQAQPHWISWDDSARDFISKALGRSKSL